MTISPARFAWPAIAALILTTLFLPTADAQSRVTIESVRGGFQLTRNGQPYFIRGGGGSVHLDLLAKSGGNSIRTWGLENISQILDEAQAHGLTVTVGFWLGHERHGFNYQDHAAVWNQLQVCLKAVETYKDHPAVLMWGIGNEMEADGNNPAIWYAIEHIAKECRRIDPNHPTMTVISEPLDEKVLQIERYCPSIQVIGLNSYGSVSSLTERFRKSGCSKPFVVTEFGPAGPWEVERTGWGAPLEVSSTAKAAQYRKAYTDAVLGMPERCLGSYAFIWGNKQETTATWFGLLLPDGRRTEAVDVLSEFWKEQPVQNHCPQIQSLQIEQTDLLKPGQKLKVTLQATDPDGDQFQTDWVMTSDAVTIGVGGDQQSPESHIEGLTPIDGTQAVLTVPESGGAYRVFAYVTDPFGGVAVANVPIRVDAPVRLVAATSAALPYSLYDDVMNEETFVPSGYMGYTEAIRMNPACDTQPHSGSHCLKVTYLAGDAWGGVLWQSPPNDWKGAAPGGLNFQNAAQLEFWARGETGTEVVSFLIGAIEGEGPYVIQADQSFETSS